MLQTEGDQAVTGAPAIPEHDTGSPIDGDDGNQAAAGGSSIEEIQSVIIPNFLCTKEMIDTELDRVLC